MPVWQKLAIYSGAILGALLIVSVFFAITSNRENNPFYMFVSIFDGAFGSEKRVWRFFKDSAFLLGISLALLPAFKMKFWNLGANGQIVISALVTYAIMRWGSKSDIPLWLGITMMIVFGVGAGMVWAAIPAIFKAFFRTNETLFTLMMNYIAGGLVAVMTRIWFPTGSGSVQAITDYVIPELGNTYVLPILIIAVIAVVMYFYLTKSKHGYELALVGESENTARYAGINVKKVFIRTLILSGAICGVVGVLLAGGIDHVVTDETHSGMGFTAIMTVWLANFNPLITVGTCSLITFISRGMEQVRVDYGFTNQAVSNVALGLIYFFIIACFFFINYRIVFRKTDKAERKVAVDGKGGQA